MSHRLNLAYAAYLLLGAGAWFTLSGRVRLAVLILLAALAFKTWLQTRLEP
ncbi:MAG: hypothetical protein SFV54_04890 [Bryobacteraceae bacterium]|nr:hypothetical protein [Bryobacteraceae bacterium]